MNTVLIVIGVIIAIISLFFLFIGWGAQREKKRISESIGTTPDRLDKKMFGRPGLGMTLGIIGIIIGLVLIFANM